MYKTIRIDESFKKEAGAFDYFLLMKPRVMSLVVFTGLVGLLLAPGKLHPLIAFTSIICITLGAGAAAAINMWYDKDIDALMKRTQKRPIITGIIHPDEALALGITMGFFSVILMVLCVNLLSGFLLLFTILYYVFIYTIWLKRTNIQNVVIGGVAGALPPMIGWATVTNDISIQSITLFAIIFMWTPPHSWALALYRIEDYTNCKVPMMPVIKGYQYTVRQIILYSILMFITSLLPFFNGMASITYLIIANILGMIFLYFAFNLLKNTQSIHAKKLFLYSIFYLFVIFLCLMIEGLLKI